MQTFGQFTSWERHGCYCTAVRKSDGGLAPSSMAEIFSCVKHEGAMLWSQMIETCDLLRFGEISDGSLYTREEETATHQERIAYLILMGEGSEPNIGLVLPC